MKSKLREYRERWREFRARAKDFFGGKTLLGRMFNMITKLPLKVLAVTLGIDTLLFFTAFPIWLFVGGIVFFVGLGIAVLLALPTLIELPKIIGEARRRMRAEEDRFAVELAEFNAERGRRGLAPWDGTGPVVGSIDVSALSGGEYLGESATAQALEPLMEPVRTYNNAPYSRALILNGVGELPMKIRLL